jgi:uncharacterized protein YwgA
MFEEYAKIALAIDTCEGGVDGRKKLQKMIYIAEVLGYPLEEYFTLHLYGPYSQELAADVQRMKEMDIVIESEMGNHYLITLTEDGERFLEHFQENIKEDIGVEKFNKMKNFFKKLSSYEPWKLEIISTLLYFYQIGYTDFDYLQQKVRTAKPKFSPDEVSNMMKEVRTFIEEFMVQ